MMKSIPRPGANKVVRILGTHGVPASYGGFETAVERIGLHLVSKGWRVVLYCQTKGKGPLVEDTWNGIERVRIPTNLPSWKGTGYYDWVSYRHAMRHHDLCAVFGYNTGLLNVMLHTRGIPTVINMDGIEWKRERWSLLLKAVLRINERFTAIFGDHLIADHPVIADYLGGFAPMGKITTIAYGADRVENAPVEPIAAMGLEPERYLTLIARPMPENSILELVQGFSAKRRGLQLVVLGRYDFEGDAYHRAVRAAASEEVDFVGGIYDAAVLRSLRHHSLAYLHGHRVGGTNPSLVEALGAGNAVIAHDNRYNRWVAGDGAIFFKDAADAEKQIDRLVGDEVMRRAMQAASRERFAAEFEWERICSQYEALFEHHLPVGRGHPTYEPGDLVAPSR